jgi:hypothetical protein
VNLGSDLEASIWMDAAWVYRASLHQIIGQAFAQYKREPGIDDLTRLHMSVAGSDTLNIPGSFSPPPARNEGESAYLEIRHRLRWHIVRHLQQRLIADGHATNEKRDDLLGTDLGL